MIKRATCVLVGLALVAAAPATGAAPHKPKKHSASATVRTITLSSTGQPPVSGTALGVGTVQGPLGSGAIVGTTTFNAPAFTNVFTFFLPKGSLKGTLSGTGTANADGSISFSGSGKVTGGKGVYKGATGSFTFTGSQPANSSVSTFNVTGSVKY